MVIYERHLLKVSSTNVFHKWPYPLSNLCKIEKCQFHSWSRAVKLH